MTATRTRHLLHPCPGCAHQIKVRMYACPGCWRRLPGNLRTAIVRAYGRRQHGVDGAAGEHTKAKATATEWLEQHPREESHR